MGSVCLSRVDGLELRDDLFVGLAGAEGDDDDHEAGDDEGGEQLVDGEEAAELGNAELPHEDHHSAGEHTRDRAPLVRALPEQAEQHDRAEGSAEAGPRKGDDTEDGAVGVGGEDHAEDRHNNNGETGEEHILLVVELYAEDIIDKIVGNAGGSA